MRKLLADITLPWAVLFVLASLLVTQLANENAKSRIAGLRAITEGHVLSIDNYKDWTMDWSLSPNGHIYSNKAPGGVLLGLPVFWLTDAFTAAVNPGKIDEKGRRPEPGYLQGTLLVLLTQILPFALLVLFASGKLAAWGYSNRARHFFALAACFGNTASIYMNSYFGHGLAAILVLGFALFWLERRYALASCLVACALLTDYFGFILIPLFAVATLLRERSLKPVLPALAGALPAGALWIWYHLAAFGSPFAFATKFNNPALMEDVADRTNQIHGYAFFPKPELLFELVLGPSRGLLFTQPWLLLALCLSPLFFLRKLESEKPRYLSAILFVSTLALLWINAGYGVWHGGWCAGPRYLSLLFPAWALVAAMELDRFPRAATALWASLVIALAFRVLIFPHGDLAPASPLWPYYFGQYANGHLGTSLLRLALLAVATGACVFWWRKREHA